MTSSSLSPEERLPVGLAEQRISKAQEHLFVAKGLLEAALEEAQRYLPQYEHTRERVAAAIAQVHLLLDCEVSEALGRCAAEQQEAEDGYRRRDDD